MVKKVKDENIQKALMEFLEGYFDGEKRVYPSIKEACERNGISSAQVYRIAKRDSWQDQKNLMHTQVNEKVKESRVDKLAEERILLDDRCLQLATAGLAHVNRHFQQAGEEPLTTARLESLMRTLTSAQKVGKLALGEAQEIQKVAADVTVPDAFEQFVREVEELGRRKAAFGSHSIN